MISTTDLIEQLQQLILRLSEGPNSKIRPGKHHLDTRDLPIVIANSNWLNVAYYASFYLDADRTLIEAHIAACDYPINSSILGKLTREEYNERCSRRHFFVTSKTFSSVLSFSRVEDLSAALQKVSETGKTLLPETLVVMAPEILSVDDELYKTTKEALLQVFTIKNLATETVEDTVAYRKKLIQEKLLGNLNTGVQAWNEISESERTFLGWQKLDLADMKLSKINFDKMDFSYSSFEGADLTSANLSSANLEGATLCRCKLAKANLTDANASSSDFTGADLSTSKLTRANLQNATLLQSNLSKAKLVGADIRNVDLSTANIDGADFKTAVYDETTKFPPEFSAYKQLIWGGWKPDPIKLTERCDTVARCSAHDLASFLQQVQTGFDIERFKKALAMLKKERFELFSDVDETHMVGVVKSQTSEELAYACHLRADGAFGCCTQNLNPCGGLRGALCKHLLVLAIGLVQNKKVDYTKCLQWILLSRLEDKPYLDKERMSNVFLRYESAQSGALDWRPMETIPEDYYSF